MPYLLDTNHCIYLLNGWRKSPSQQTAFEKNTVSAFEQMKEDMVFMSEVTLGELFFGAECSQKRAHNLASIATIQSAVVPLSVDQPTWKIFGETKAQLRKRGKKIPDMDLLIAATAKRYELTLVANDQHMDSLPETFEFSNWAVK